MTARRLATFVLALCATLAALAGTAASAGQYPDTWYWERPEEHTRFEGRPAPKLEVGEWANGPFKLEDMKGKIVVVDFWATWSEPSKKTLPHLNKLAKSYAKEGVVFVGVCASGEADEMKKIFKDAKITYPTAFAKGEQVVTDWPIQWYPTQAVIDAKGTVRAIGLKPDRVEDVIESLLTEQAAAKGQARIHPDWLEGTAAKRERLKRLEEQAEAPPKLAVDKWINSDPLTLDGLKGKVVVLDFWATWSKTCIQSIERHNELIDKYSDQGLVIIGVCASLKGEFMPKTAEDHGIRYPVCVDKENKTSIAYGVNGFPDYYIIDRSGKLRIADCSNASLEDAVKALLSEKVSTEGAASDGADEPEDGDDDEDEDE